MSAKILIVEDEQNIVDVLKANLERDGYETLVAYDGAKALEMAFQHKPDLILLDCMLPKIDGYEVCRRLRGKMNMPILMLTARSEEVDKVVGLELGADDYMTKPFSVRELLARVKAQLRRFTLSENEEPTGKRIYKFGNLEIDTISYTCRLNGEPVLLSILEFNLVAFLAAHAGKVFSREELFEKVWGYGYYGDLRTVDVTIRRTRKKIEPDQSNYQYIMTKRGVGYYFADDQAIK